MNDLRKEFYEISSDRKIITDEIKELENDEKVKRYIELKKINDSLYDKQSEVYKSMKFDEYEKCKHILVCSKIEYDEYDNRNYKSCGCIKCGLDSSVLHREKNYLPYTYQIMYDYLKQHSLKGINTNISCNIDLGQAIYSKIIENNPDIDEETAIKYFETALNNIRNIDVNDERKINRAERLSLSPKFNRWNSNDICDN